MTRPADSDKTSGNHAGRRQRQRDQSADSPHSYPRSGMPIGQNGRSPTYVKAFQDAYYQTSLGNPNLGDEPVMVPVDRGLYEQVVNLGKRPAEVASEALALACGEIPTHRLIATASPTGANRMTFTYACGQPRASIVTDRAVAVLQPEDWTLVTCIACLNTGGR